MSDPLARVALRASPFLILILLAVVTASILLPAIAQGSGMPPAEGVDLAPFRWGPHPHASAT